MLRDARYGNRAEWEAVVLEGLSPLRPLTAGTYATLGLAAVVAPGCQLTLRRADCSYRYHRTLNQLCGFENWRATRPGVTSCMSGNPWSPGVSYQRQVETVDSFYSSQTSKGQACMPSNRLSSTSE